MSLAALLIFLVLPACETKTVSLDDTGTDTTPTGTGDDADRDGFSVAEGDCDDGNPAVNPAASEACDPDNVDEDCDGRADNLDEEATGRVLTYLDADDDGFGARGAKGEYWCDPPIDKDADNNADCDDTNAAIYPAAEDPTDGEGVDNDCDGFVDEDGLVPASVLVTEMYWRGDDVLSSYVPTNGLQWVELYNNTSAVLDLSGWIVRFCHVPGAEVLEPPTAAACTPEETSVAVMPRGTRLNIGDWLVVCSDRTRMPTCDVDFDFTASAMSVRHGYLDVRLENVTIGPAYTTAPTEIRLDAVSWWYVDLQDYWPNSSSRSIRLADTEYQGADWDDVNDTYGTPGAGDDPPSWDVWCLPTSTQTFELDGDARYGSPGAANGAECG